MFQRLRGLNSKHKSLFLVVAVALLARLATSLLHITHGIVPAPFVGPMPWADYNVYVAELHFVAQGYLPYRDFGFNYMPLFLYALLPFYLLVGTYGPSIVIVVSDALTAGVIYLIVSRKQQTQLAFAAGLAYALLPFALYNEGYLWLSSQPMTLFGILSLYFLMEDRPYQSFGLLAVSVLFKQETVVLLPVFLFWEFRHGLSRAMKSLTIFITAVSAVSIPFLVLSASNYLYAITYTLAKLGHLYPAVVAFPVGAASPSQSMLTCSNTTVPGLFTGQVCSNTNVLRMTWVVTEPLLNRVVASTEGLLAGLTPLFLLLLCVSLYSLRRSKNFPQLISAASILVLLVAFGAAVHIVFAYYFLPVYALMFAASTDYRTLGIAIVGALLPVLAPEGPLQAFLPVSFLLLMAVATDLTLSRQVVSSEAHSRPSSPVGLLRPQESQ